MHAPTGKLYGSLDEALAYHPADEIVTLLGTPQQVESISRVVARNHRANERKRAARKAAQASRRRNR